MSRSNRRPGRVERDGAMTYFEAIILGIVQGITEFLPISSDGHLLIAQHFLGRDAGARLDDHTVTVALHAGTLAAIVIFFLRDLLGALRRPRLMLALVIATLPLVPLGLFAKEFITVTIQTLPMAGLGFLATAAFLFLLTRLPEGTRTLDDVGPADALVIGLFQALAPAPGLSRSGSTIFGGVIRGLTRDAAAKFSFLMAVPAISGALVLDARDLLKGQGSSIPTGPLMVGVLVSFLVGLAAIRILMTLVVRRRLQPFAWYCLALGLAVLAGSAFSRS